MHKENNTDLILEQFSEGVFLTAGVNPNPMTLGWGQIGIMWGKRVFLAPVRDSRFTYGLIRQTECFTLSVPAAGKMKKELAYCGTKSGKNVDKWQEARLTAQRAKSIAAYVVAGCDKYFECKVIAAVRLGEENYMDKHTLDAWYRSGDMHTLFIGEIVEAY